MFNLREITCYFDYHGICLLGANGDLIVLFFWLVRAVPSLAVVGPEARKAWGPLKI